VWFEMALGLAVERDDAAWVVRFKDDSGCGESVAGAGAVGSVV